MWEMWFDPMPWGRVRLASSLGEAEWRCRVVWPKIEDVVMAQGLRADSGCGERGAGMGCGVSDRGADTGVVGVCEVGGWCKSWLCTAVMWGVLLVFGTVMWGVVTGLWCVVVVLLRCEGLWCCMSCPGLTCRVVF